MGEKDGGGDGGGGGKMTRFHRLWETRITCTPETSKSPFLV